MFKENSEFGHSVTAWHDSETGPALRYRVQGETGPSVVLLHELGGGIESWDLVLPPLAECCCVLRYDQRGQGLSEKVRAQFSVTEHVDDLDAVLAISGLPAPYWLVGAAAGSAIAVAYALRAPHKVAGLILCAPALTTDEARKDYLERRSDLAIREGMRAVVDQTLARSFPPKLRGDRAAFDAYRSRLMCSDPVGYAYANLALLAAQLKDELPQLDCPCLLLAGCYDELRPTAYVKEMADQIRNVRVEEVESGHLIALQAPDILVDRLLGFIATSTDATPSPTHHA